MNQGNAKPVVYSKIGKHAKDGKRKVIRVGFISRIDYPSKGFRKGLLDLAASTFCIAPGIDFVVIAGGLISNHSYRQLLKENIAKALQQRKNLIANNKSVPREDKETVETITEIRSRIREETLDAIALGLADLIPEFTNSEGKKTRIYIITSPAINYDGENGPEIAQRLSRSRPDISYWGHGDQRVRLKGILREDGKDKDFWVVLPTKAAWRSKYFSTRPDRLIEDISLQTTQDLPELWISDCACVSLIRPRGELSRPRVSTPGLHRLQEVTTSENQVGVRVVEFYSDSDNPFVRTFSLKDYVANERTLIVNPQVASALQIAILEELKKYPQTIGMLEDALRKNRELIEQALTEYRNGGFDPLIVYDDASKKYDIAISWLQTKLAYPVIDSKKLKVDAILAFGCLHAGYNSTQYQYFVHDLPKIILQHGITTLVGAGDYIAGLKHDLHLRGEVFVGMNYTKQEELAASLVGAVMFKVFKARFDLTRRRKNSSADEQSVMAAVEKSLLDFRFWRGNHDKWTLDFGIDPLTTFRTRLTAYLIERIEEYLSKRNFFTKGVGGIVRAHIIYSDEHVLHSGLKMSINHPEMARAQTTSLRAQHTLGARKGFHIAVLANFHTAEEVLQWERDLGQRVALQVGTLVSGTDFEDGKLKTVDTGVGILKVYSQDQRIIATETIFEGPREEDEERLDSNSIVVTALYDRFSI
ncbi:MAG: hypothetical protein HYV65_02045 [Candidatus Spechtbacteria bacterium]|nr:hypothetical protein [Candidatus Spechtbacteria bacterium]